MTRRTDAKRFLVALPMAVALFVAGCASVPPPVAIERPVFPPPPDEPRFYFERTLYSSADVMQEDSSMRLRRTLTGESRAGEALAKPYGVAVYHGRVYVGDTVARGVMVFDIPRQRFFRIGEEEPGRLAMPLGLDVDGHGNLYVVDASSKKVMVYDGEGKFLRTIGDPNSFMRPSGIAVDAEGERVYVVDTGTVSSQGHLVRVLDAKTGATLFDIGKRGREKGEFNLPRDVVIGKDGMLYVVDGGNFRVQSFRPDGTFVNSFGEVGRRSGQFSRPKEAAVDGDGNIYVVDAAFGNYQIFNPAGQLLLAIGGRGEVDGMAKYMLPAGIAVDGDGRVYLVDQYFGKVDVYRPARIAENEGFAVPKPLAATKK